MKILFIDNCYPEFLSKIQSDAEALSLSKYKDIKNHYYGYYFGTSDFYSKHMGRMSGCISEDVIVNYELLQNSWATENNKGLKLLSEVIKKTPKARNYYKIMGNPFILLQQIKQIKPDVIYVQCPSAFPPIITNKLKKYCKALVCQIASNLPPMDYFANYNLVISSLPNMVKEIQSHGIQSLYMPLFFEEDILKKITLNEKKYDVTHLGGYGKIHDERNKILEEVGKSIKIDFWGYGTEYLSKDSPILKNYHGKIWGLEYFNLLANSKITLTGHIKKVAGDYANNMTLFEATGCGALLITDFKKNLHELFELEKEIVTYRDPLELKHKIKYYLLHDDEREKIAKAGQRRTLKDHTYSVGMKELKIILERLIKNR